MRYFDFFFFQRITECKYLNSTPRYTISFSCISFYLHALALDFLTQTAFRYHLIPSLIRGRNGR